MKRSVYRGFLASLLGLCVILTLGIGVTPITFVNGVPVPRTADATATSPQWNVTWGLGGMEVANDACTDTQGNLYVTGYVTNPSGYQDVFLAKFDQTGELYAVSYWGGSGNDQGQSVDVDDTGNAYVTGHTYSFGAGSTDIFVLKYSSEGVLLWNITWGGPSSDIGTYLEVTPDGRVYVCGQTQSFGEGGNDFSILKLSTEGILLWNRTFGGIYGEIPRGLCVTPEKTVVIVGMTQSWGVGGDDLCIVAYDKNGLFLWNNSWGGSLNEMGLTVDLDSAGNFVVTGYTQSFGAGFKDVAIMAFNSAGSLLWNTTWGAGKEETATAALVDLDGNIYIAGYSNSMGLGGYDFILVKFSSTGVVLLNDTWGGPLDDYGEGIARSRDSIYLVGYSNSWSTESNNVIVLSYNLPLDINWTTVWISAIIVAGITIVIVFLVWRKKQR